MFTDENELVRIQDPKVNRKGPSNVDTKAVNHREPLNNPFLTLVTDFFPPCIAKDDVQSPRPVNPRLWRMFNVWVVIGSFCLWVRHPYRPWYPKINLLTNCRQGMSRGMAA